MLISGGYVLDINNGLIICYGLIANTTIHPYILTFPHAFFGRYTVLLTDWSAQNEQKVVPCGCYFNNNTVTSAYIDFYYDQPRGFGYAIIGY